MVATGLGSKKSNVEDYILNKPKKDTKKLDPAKGMETIDVRAAFSGIATRMK